jgi:predicted TIM-barrel fold metal-dependent hydrolase
VWHLADIDLLGNPDGMPYLPEWSEETHLELMDKLNIRKSILSISSPGTHLVPGDDKLAAKVARECNQYAADLKKRMPDRFGYFAALPIPDVETCLREIDLASQEGCDGFVMLTNGHGVYPGDKQLDPIFDELNRRQAIIFFHPTTPKCPCSPEAIAAGQKPVNAAPFAGKYPNPMLEFLFDTARIFANLFMSGTIKRCPNVQFLFAHCGGSMPPLLSRFTGFSTLVPGPWTGVTEDDVHEAFKKQIWFDTAGFPFPGQIKGLMEAGVQPDRLFYGSDYPFTRADGVGMLLGQMDKGTKENFSDEQIESICHGNAEKLLGHPMVR